MDTCFPLLKLKHHCEQQERERAPEGEQPEIASAHCWHRGEETRGRVEVGPGPPASSAVRSPRRPSSPRPHLGLQPGGGKKTLISE